MKNCDVIVIGGGPGGYGAAVRLAQLGKKVCLFEKDQIGGTCLNRGCIPTKALMHGANLYAKMQNAGDYGVFAEGLGFDFDQMHRRKAKIQEDLRGGMESLLKANKVDIIHEKAVISGPSQVMAAGEAYTADSIVIAAGSVPARPPIPGLDLPGVSTSDEVLAGGKLYDSLVIIGGGVIGVELGSLYSDLGCQVTIIEALDRITANFDREISQNLTMILKKRGVSIFTAAAVKKLEGGEGALTVTFEQKGKTETVAAQGVLAAMGRKAMTAGLFQGLEVAVDRGCIAVNDGFETSIPGVYAIGDIIGGVQLAHKAEYEGRAVAEIICGLEPTVDTKLVPACVYTEPEIAAVGLTADECKAQGIPVITGKYVMGGNAKSVIEGGERSFVKLVFSEMDKRLLGAHIMCPRATDIIGELTAAVAGGLGPEDLARSMHPHPSFVEGIAEAAEVALGGSLHTMPGKK